MMTIVSENIKYPFCCTNWKIATTSEIKPTVNWQVSHGILFWHIQRPGTWQEITSHWETIPFRPHRLSAFTKRIFCAHGKLPLSVPWINPVPYRAQTATLRWNSTSFTDIAKDAVCLRLFNYRPCRSENKCDRNNFGSNDTLNTPWMMHQVTISASAVLLKKKKNIQPRRHHIFCQPHCSGDAVCVM